MGKELELSVIIPVYNGEDCLKKCVDSVCAQTLKNMEILLVDDGSTDKTGQLCDKLAENDERIRVFHKQNGGTSSARNLGIENAEGAYIGFVDSDDFIEPDMYEQLLLTAKKEQLAMVQISRDEINPDGTRRKDVCIPPQSRQDITADLAMEELLMHRGDCSFCTRITRKDLFEGQNFPEGKLNEDFYLLVTMLPKLKKIVILPTQSYHVYYRPESNSRTKNQNAFPQVYTDIVENAEYAMLLVDKCYPKLHSVCMRFGFYQRLDYLLHIPVAMMTKENHFYRQIISYLRHNMIPMLKNPYLTAKNKQYLFLLTIAPCFVRKIHAGIMNRRK